jgi:hypothetical protein
MNKKSIPLFKECTIIISTELRGKDNFPNGINSSPNGQLITYTIYDT